MASRFLIAVVRFYPAEVFGNVDWCEPSMLGPYISSALKRAHDVEGNNKGVLILGDYTPEGYKPTFGEDHEIDSPDEDKKLIISCLEGKSSDFDQLEIRL